MDWQPNGKVETMLGAQGFGGASEFYLYSHEEHGFLTRGDTKLEHTTVAIGEVIDKMVVFVNKVVVLSEDANKL